MKSLTTISKMKFVGLIGLLGATLSLSACSSNSADQNRLAMQADEQEKVKSAEHQDSSRTDRFDQGVSPGANFGRWMAGQSD
jgi:hypothetical protein